MKIAPEGYRLIAPAALLAVGGLMAGWPWAGAVFTAATLGLLGFFRDPDRLIPQEEGLVVAPADGTVVSIATVDRSPLVGSPAARISVFLSPLDVHINRMPVAATIEDIEYRQGKFIAAFKDVASEQNEQNTLALRDDKGRKLAVVQVAGIVARRIVCRAHKGDVLKRGDRFGLIMFGSRTDLYLPDDCRLEVNVGDKIRGGETIVGRFV